MMVDCAAVARTLAGLESDLARAWTAIRQAEDRARVLRFMLDPIIAEGQAVEDYDAAERARWGGA
jgi:hypothetical protein